MRRTALSLAVLGLHFALALAVRAGEAEPAAVIDKAIKAHFPKGLDTKNRGLRTKSKGTLHVMGLDLDYTQEVAVQVPNQFKEVMELTVMNKKVTVTSVFNGKEGWIRADDKDVPVGEDILDEFKEAAYTMGLVQGLFLKDKALKFTSVGEAQVKGKSAVGVRISKEGKKDVTLYFDKGTGLIAKVELRKRDLATGQEVTEERFITEYQEIADRKVARKVEVHRDGSPLMEAEVTEVQVLEKLDAGEFGQPK
jgi:hypothetical protein